MEGEGMAVFRFKARKYTPEEYTESGIVVAGDKDEAKAKLKQHGFSKVRLERIRRISAL